MVNSKNFLTPVEQNVGVFSTKSPSGQTDFEKCFFSPFGANFRAETLELDALLFVEIESEREGAFFAGRNHDQATVVV